MSKPVIAIVGRPNVGKSALFNRLVRRRVAIVDPTPGVTRDRIAAEVEVLDRRCLLLDTGGLDPTSKDELIEKVAGQVQVAIDEADVILFVIDGREGVTSLDIEIARRLRKSNKPMAFVANKIDTPHVQMEEFHELRLGEPLPVSALHGVNVSTLLTHIHQLLPPPEPDETELADQEGVRLAIVGRPNVGKSALLNAIVGEERSIVSPIPGTTRDAIDTPFEWNGQQLVLIDTAGIRRKSKVKSRLEYYCVVRALGAIDRCDVAILVIDAVEGVTNQDAKIAGYAHDTGKPTVLVVNKWDLVAAKLTETAKAKIQLPSTSKGEGQSQVRRQEKLLQSDFARFLHQELGFLDYAPIVYTCALDGFGVEEVLRRALYCYQQSCRRISTALLNRALQEIVSQHPPPTKAGRQLKVYYATNPQTNPPTFVLFVNDEELMHFSYLRYLENRLRERFDIQGTPVRFVLRPSGARRE